MQIRYPASLVLSMLPLLSSGYGQPAATRKGSRLTSANDQTSTFLIVQVQRLWIEGQPYLVVDVDGADAHDPHGDLRLAQLGNDGRIGS